MKFRRFLLFSVLISILCLALSVPVARAQNSVDGLRVKIESEEPSGIFIDSDTLELRRSILFSIQFFNETKVARNATLTWRIQDASGKVVQSGDEKYPIAANGYVSRRELFIPPARGEYLLSADGYGKRDGPDLKARSEFAFTVIAAPPSQPTRPLLLLDAPLQIPEKKLDIYAKLGVRALRTVLNPETDNAQNTTPADFWKRVDNALQARYTRGLGTVGVLRAPVGNGPRRARDDEEWLQFALLAITRTPSIRTWEITGEAAPETISELARAAHNMNPSRTLLAEASPFLAAGDVRRLLPADGLLLAVSPEMASVHPAALRRALVAANNRTKEAGGLSFHVREAGANRDRNITPLEDAAALTIQTVSALASGAQGVSSAFETSDETSAADVSTPDYTRQSRGAVFAAMAKMLGNADFHSELFPTSPIISGVLFGKANGSVAVLWTSPGSDGKPEKARLETWLQNVQAMDVFGNPIAGVDRKKPSVNLGSQPIYLQSNLAPEALARALREATISGLDPLAAQVLPFTQPLEYSGVGKPKDNKFAPASKTALRVRLQNVGIAALSGTLKVNPPPSWKLENDTQQWNLNPGESRIYAFPVALVKTNDQYPVVVDATSISKVGNKTVRGHWGWTQNALVATATNVTAEDNLQVDGALGDWKNAAWMEMPSHLIGKRKVKAQLAVKWDANRLYLAAKVREPRLQPRPNSNADYAFWQDSDAIQFAFGLRDAAWMQPGNAPFRDTDAGFLLSPFHTRPDGTIEARVLRLWNSQIPFGAVSDRVRWGGAVPGARIEIVRDEREGTTNYEAAIPLSEIADLNPSVRAATAKELDSPTRFSWILHNDEGGALQWSEANHVFDWWNNTGSFLPSQNFSFAAQTLLGFSRKGEVAAGNGSTPSALTPVEAPPIVTPPVELPEENLEPYFPVVETPPTPNPTPKPTPRPQSTPAPTGTLPKPVPTEPIPPDMLPPAPRN